MRPARQRQDRKPFTPPSVKPSARIRLVAAELLHDVLGRRRTLDEALADNTGLDALQGPDRGFARAISSAALRHLGQIDTALAVFLDRPFAETPEAVKAFLRVGAAQVWVMNTAPHAAVAETVEAAKAMEGAHRAVGFLNAVIRKLADARSGFDALAADATWPDWLRNVMRDSLGAAAANDLASAQLTVPALDLAVRDGDAEDWAERLGGRVVDGAVVRLDISADVDQLAGYADGAWWVQDRAAQVPVRLLGDVSGARVLDMCAAPGGKAMQLAAAGADVVALDRSKKRLQRVRENAERTRLSDRITTLAADAEVWGPEERFDAVLLDAPCSAMGTLRRHPEGAWIKRAEDVARFPDIQSRLLRAGLDRLGPGGSLVYCVCSPIRAEGRDVVDHAVNEGLCRIVPSETVSSPERWRREDGTLLTLPEPDAPNGLHDAFFAARLSV